MHYPFDLQAIPLDSWGQFYGRRRLSESPYIESIWEGSAFDDGAHFTAADGTIDLVLLKSQDAMRLLLSGPTSKVRQTSFKAGDEVLAIKLRPGVHFPSVPEKYLVDLDQFLPAAGRGHFWLHSLPFIFPDFNNVETFIDQLAKIHLIERDIVVENTLANKPPFSSKRTVQRHFIQSTGLTMNHIHQIKRAEKARHMISSTSSLAAVAYEVGYSNPGHMTNAFKYFFGQTPSAMQTSMRR
jgi:hypothetical protein